MCLKIIRIFGLFSHNTMLTKSMWCLKINFNFLNLNKHTLQDEKHHFWRTLHNLQFAAILKLTLLHVCKLNSFKNNNISVLASQSRDNVS